MKTVLILANSISGLCQFRIEIVRALIDSGCKVIVSVPKGEEYFENMVLSSGAEIVTTEFSRHGTNPLQDILLLKRYIKVIKDKKVDIVFTYTIKPNIYGGIASRICHVSYVANITGLGTAVENGGIMQKITLFLYRIGLKNAQKVFFQNNQNCDFMLTHKVVKEKYDVLPGSGVNLSIFVPTEYPHNATVDFVFVARVIKEKGIDQYLQAAESITRKYPNAVFHICGAFEQDYKETLDVLQTENIIKYHGVVSDMRPIYNMSACTIHPTYYPEGMSNVLLESCASARPIITTDRSGCREIVDDGINGYIVREKDSDDLIQKIERFLSLSVEERKKMGLAGRRKVEKEFDRSIVIEKYLGEL